MFWNKRMCRRCDAKIDSEWSFCPNCGIGLKEDSRPKDVSQINKLVEMQAPKFMPKNPKAKGVSITITSDSFSPPKIDVQTYGNQPHHHHHVVERPIPQPEEKPVRIAKTTQEPKTKIKRIHNKQIITLDMPDVKNLDDIEIKQLQQSIEIKAFAGDKAYFKLIPVPSDATVNNEFKDGVLKIEVSK